DRRRRALAAARGIGRDGGGTPRAVAATCSEISQRRPREIRAPRVEQQHRRGDRRSERMNRITIFDTTLRDGEQAPGFSMTLDEKVRMARQLESLGVGVIEAGFPISSDGDFA